MNELINITYDSERPMVLGRELHDALQVKTAYRDWFPRMCEYGFLEGVDFRSFFERKFRWPSCEGSPTDNRHGKGNLYAPPWPLTKRTLSFVPVSGYFHVVFLQFVPISLQIVVDGQLLKAKKCRKSRYV